MKIPTTQYKVDGAGTKDFACDMREVKPEVHTTGFVPTTSSLGADELDDMDNSSDEDVVPATVLANLVDKMSGPKRTEVMG